MSRSVVCLDVTEYFLFIYLFIFIRWFLRAPYPKVFLALGRSRDGWTREESQRSEREGWGGGDSHCSQGRPALLGIRMPNEVRSLGGAQWQCSVACTVAVLFCFGCSMAVPHPDTKCPNCSLYSKLQSGPNHYTIPVIGLTCGTPRGGGPEATS